MPNTYDMSVNDRASEFLRSPDGADLVRVIEHLRDHSIDTLVNMTGTYTIEEIRRQNGVIIGIGQVLDLIKTKRS